MREIESGDRVWAKHKNGRYYRGKISDVKEQMFIEMDFDDGSYSKDMYPEDIAVSSGINVYFIGSVC